MISTSLIADAIRGLVVEGEGGEVAYTRVTIDSRRVAPGDLFVALPGTRVDGHDFVAEAARRGARGALVHRGVHGLPPSFQLLEVKDTLRALQELATFVRSQFRGRVVAITGSNGKTTTKEMTAAILASRWPVAKAEGNWNSLIGLPLALLHVEAKHRACVLETGTNHPGEIRRLAAIARPHIGVITNVGPVHLEGLGSIEGVLKEKWDLVRGLEEGGVAILCGDDPLLRERARRWKGSVVTFGLSSENDVYPSEFGTTEEGFPWFRFSRGEPVVLRVLGRPNILNALAAAVVAKEMGLPFREVKAGLESVSPAPMRMDRSVVAGVTLLDDTYNANPVSIYRAAETLAELPVGGRRVAVLGGMAELGERTVELHRGLGRDLAHLPLDILVGVGVRGTEILAGYAAAGGGMARCEGTADLEAARGLLQGLLGEGDAVLFKASRSVGLEVLVAGVKADLEARGGTSRGAA